MAISGTIQCELRVLIQHVPHMLQILTGRPVKKSEALEIAGTRAITIYSCSKAERLVNAFIPLVTSKYPFDCYFPLEQTFIFGRYTAELSYDVTSEPIYDGFPLQPAWDHQHQRYCEMLTHQLINPE